MSKKGTASITVLVVDDEELDRTNASIILRAEGYDVLQAENYTDAMAVFDLNRNSLRFLVADVSLPDGNGCALAIAIQKEIPDLRVLFVSGHVGAEVCKYYGLEVAALHFLRKPYDAVELATRVREILTGNQPRPRLLAPKASAASGEAV